VAPFVAAALFSRLVATADAKSGANRAFISPAISGGRIWIPIRRNSQPVQAPKGAPDVVLILIVTLAAVKPAPSPVKAESPSFCCGRVFE